MAQPTKSDLETMVAQLQEENKSLIGQNKELKEDNERISISRSKMMSRLLNAQHSVHAIACTKFPTRQLPSARNPTFYSGEISSEESATPSLWELEFFNALTHLDNVLKD